MATSYSNPSGTGDRQNLITITPSTGLTAGNVQSWVNGVNTYEAISYFYGNVDLASGTNAPYSLVFDFENKKLIQEMKYYQQAGSITQGTWKWQACDDNSSWSDISSTFVLTPNSGTGIYTDTSLSGNTGYYRYYKMLGVSGSTNQWPWVFEIEFKIDGSTSGPRYANLGGRGDRTAIIATTSQSGLLYLGYNGGSEQNLVNGALLEYKLWFNIVNLASGPNAPYWLRFDFGTPKVVTESKYYQTAGSNAQGTWKWQGSNDNSVWVDVSGSFAFASGTTGIDICTALNANTAAYRYYRMLGISGTTTESPWVYEFEFKLIDKSDDTLFFSQL